MEDIYSEKICRKTKNLHENGDDEKGEKNINAM
jgi:hypothetical protein